MALVYEVVHGEILLEERIVKPIKQAWYLDEDVRLEGTVTKNRFYTDRTVCGDRPVIKANRRKDE